MVNKRLLCALLTALLLFSGMGLAEQGSLNDFEISSEEEYEAQKAAIEAAAELTTLDIALDGRVVPDEPTHLTVAGAAKADGCFFTSLFGQSTCDVDVRTMIHGYNPIVRDTQLTFAVDTQVIRDMTETFDGDGNKVYTFTLWDDLTWNDGSPITAADYVFSYVLQGSKEFAQIVGEYTASNRDVGNANVWKHIVGSEEFLSGEEPCFSGIRLLDEYSYSVTVGKEYLPYFYEYSYVSVMPSPISVIAPGCEVADDGNGAYIRNVDSQTEEPIFTAGLLRDTILDPVDGYLSHPKLTCGPYSLVDYFPKEGRVEFTVNEYFKGNYRGVKSVINDVTLVHVLPQDMPEKLRSGEIDLVNRVVDGEVINQLRSVMNELNDENNESVDTEECRGIALSSYARNGYAYFGLACEMGPQQFPKVRQAINYAFDTEGYVRDFLQGYGMSVYGFYGLGQWTAQAALGNLRPENLTEEQETVWDSFSLDGLNTYSYDPEHPGDIPLQLLIEDGWVLNEKGEPFDPETDAVRYKKPDGENGEGELMRLSFDFGLIKDNIAAEMALERLMDVMTPLGAEFIIHEEPFEVILKDVQREAGKREYDIVFMAYNFNAMFDPLSELFSVTEEEIASEELIGLRDSAGICDEELLRLCLDLRCTEPGDVQSFETKWIEFQKRFNEILPTVPIYSNIYFDFYGSCLQNYDPASEPNWPSALLYSYRAELPIIEAQNPTLSD